MTESNIQSVRNSNRLRSWRLRYFFRTGRRPDTLRHSLQMRWGALRFPLARRWPKPAEFHFETIVGRSFASNFNIIKFPQYRNQIGGRWPSGPEGT